MERQHETGASRIASIKETGEELSAEDWARFDAAIAQIKAERERASAPQILDWEDRSSEA